VTEAVETVERAHLEEALHQTQWNISRAAARLGIPRNTLRYRIEKHGLSPPDLPRPIRRGSGDRPMAAPARPAPAVPEAVPSVAVRWEPRRLALLGAQVSTRESIEPAPDASRALEILVEKAETFGGRIEELSPTGIVAVFGLDPAEDSPSRAALSALAVQKALERMRQQGPDGVTVRIGIHVGHFLVGRAGGPPAIDLDAKRQAWTILTELVAGAEPDTTRVSGAAAPFLDRRFDLVTLAGVPGAPAAAFRLTGRERTGLGLGKTVVPFVGRRHDLELLEGRLGASASGQGQVVGIVGEAGMGKSRLLFEFRESLAAQPVTYVEGHCASYGSTIPYLPVLDLLRNVCGIADLDHPEAIGEKVRAALRRLAMDPDDAAPYLLHLLGMKEGAERVGGMNPEAIKPRTFGVLSQMCLKASRQQPLVLAVENLHWIDTTSEEYLGALVDSLAGAPILFLATYRPGYRPPWMDKSYATQMALRPLSPGDSLSVVRAVARTGPLPDEVAQVILGKAEGNPFFLEELVRTVVEERGLGHRGAVPDTIQEVLLARIDRLSREARHLLQTASVLGRDVSLRLLRALWEEPDTLGAPLRELTRLEFLYERSGLDEPGYVFKHALIQEVAYGSLTESRRRHHHAAAARALEEQYGGRRHEVIEMLAHHYGLSGEGEKAVDYAILAAEKAQRRWANPEALAHFEAALARLDTMPDTPPNLVRRIDAVVSQAEVKFALGRHAEHIQALEGIRHLVAAVADPRRQAAWYYWTGFLHSLTGGRPDVAIGYCRQAAAIAEAGGFEEIRAYAECCLAQVSAFAGELRVALEAGERALTTFEARGDAWWACRTLGVLSMTANSLGEWGRSLDYCHRARAHAEAMDDLRRRVVAWWQTAWTHVLRGDPRAGLDCCDEALALSPTRFDAAMTTAARGYGLIKAGEVAAGVAALTDAVGWFQRSRLGYSRLTCAVWLGDGYLRLGERGQARLLLEDVLAGSLELGYRRIEGSARRLLGELLAPEDRLAAGRELEAATGVLGEIGARDELAKALVTQAVLRQAEGDTPTARQLLERALSLFEASGTVDQPARVRGLLADLPA
jgi:tetratricopeptide (TPR) repeat protein